MKKIILLTGGILILVLILGAGITYFSIARSFQADLDASLAKVRKSGRPMTAAELQPAAVADDKNAAVTLAKAFANMPQKTLPTTATRPLPGNGGTPPATTSPTTTTVATTGIKPDETTPATSTPLVTTSPPATPTATTPVIKTEPAPPVSTAATGAETPAPDLARLFSKNANFSLWTPADKKEIAALLQTPAFKVFFDTVEAAARQPACNFGVNYAKYTAKAPPHLERVRDTVRALTIKAQVEAWSGSPAKAIDTALVGIKTTQFLQVEPSLVSQLMRFACERIMCSCLEALAFTYDLPAEKTLELMRFLEQMTDTTPLVKAMDGERIFFGQEEFERLMNGEHTVSELMQDSSLNKESLLAWKMSQPLGSSVVKKDYAVYLDMLGKIQEHLKTPYCQTVEQRKANPIENQIPSYCVVSRMTIPAIDTVLERAAGAQARLQLCRGGLALNLFRQKQGYYPVMLNELVPDVLAAVPSDPFTGKAFEYRRAQKGFMLYCVRGGDIGGAEVDLNNDSLFGSFTTRRPGSKILAAKP